MKSVIDQAIESKAAKTLGAKGGKSGSGAAKRRTREQCQAAAMARIKRETAQQTLFT